MAAAASLRIVTCPAAERQAPQLCRLRIEPWAHAESPRGEFEPGSNTHGMRSLQARVTHHIWYLHRWERCGTHGVCHAFLACGRVHPSAAPKLALCATAGHIRSQVHLRSTDPVAGGRANVSHCCAYCVLLVFSKIEGAQHAGIKPVDLRTCAQVRAERHSPRQPQHWTN